MALFKPYMGNRTSLDAVEKHAGHVYLCVDDGSFHLDFVDSEGNLQRKQINADEANKLVGYDIATVLNSSDTEIPTSKAVLDALENISWNDLEDRPLVMESITIIYDGNADGHVVSDPAMLCKVSDLVLTKENVIGQSVSALVAGSMNTTIITEDEITPLEDPRSFILGGVVACIAEDNTIFDGSITFPEKGVYFYSNSGAHVTSLGVANVTEVFDEKYIPSTIARKEDVVQSDWSEGNESSLSYVKNKTHYYCEGSTLVKEISITVTNENFTMLNSYITLEEGKKYKVVIDGVQDICTATHMEDVAAGENCIELTPTIEGFSVVRSRLTGGICTYVSGISLGDHVISIYEDDELKQLDEMFIPDTIARTADVAVADWSVNDETNAAYVKNRPFYESDPTITVLVEEQPVSFMNEWSNVYTTQLIVDVEFNKKDTYQITWDNLKYNLQIMESEGMLTLGDPAILNGLSTDGQPPFLMVIGVGSLTIGTLDASESHVISMACHQTEITTLPNKFLSEDVFTLNNFLNVNYTAGKTVQSEYGTGEIFNDYENNVASGEYSHAEGSGTTASNTGSHAEGSNTTASGTYSHAEGRGTVASGGYGAHAEGTKTTAAGNYSHSEGWQTTANSESQHVQGEWNIIDTAGSKNARGTYAHIVGNGTSANTRSNAHTLDWSGNSWFKGIVKVGGTSQDDENAKELATQEYVIEQILAMLAARKPKIGTVELKADAWVGEGNLYSQVVTIEGVTSYSQVDLTPSIEQLVIFYEKDLGFVTENEDGVVTVYAIGQKPENDYTIQVTITEVSV